MPTEGVTRKRRSDAGIPRKSTLQTIYDQFTDLTLPVQGTVLEVLFQIHHQRQRGAIAPPPAAAQAELTTLRLASPASPEGGK